MTQNNSPLESIAFSPDEKFLASGSNDGTIKIWQLDAQLGKASAVLLRTLVGHTNEVLSIAFSPNSQLLASGSADRTMKLWQVNDCRVLHTLTGHSGKVSSVTFSPDGQSLASGSADRTMKLWDPITGKELSTIAGHTKPVCLLFLAQMVRLSPVAAVTKQSRFGLYLLIELPRLTIKVLRVDFHSKL